VTQRPALAEVVVRALLEHVAPALADAGDLEAATELAERLLERGNGAALQRRVYEETGELSAVVNAAVVRTLV
jgi:carboxylate-amine ligase